MNLDLHSAHILYAWGGTSLNYAGSDEASWAKVMCCDSSSMLWYICHLIQASRCLKRLCEIENSHNASWDSILWFCKDEIIASVHLACEPALQGIVLMSDSSACIECMCLMQSFDQCIIWYQITLTSHISYNFSINTRFRIIVYWEYTSTTILQSNDAGSMIGYIFYNILSSDTRRQCAKSNLIWKYSSYSSKLKHESAWNETPGASSAMTSTRCVKGIHQPDRQWQGKFYWNNDCPLDHQYLRIEGYGTYIFHHWRSSLTKFFAFSSSQSSKKSTIKL